MKKLIIITFGLFLMFSLTGIGQTNVGFFFHPTLDYVNADIHHLNYSIGLKSDIKVYYGLYVKVALGYEHDYCDLTKMAHVADTEPWLATFTTNQIKTDCHLKYDFLHKNKIISFYTFCGPTMNTCFNSKENWQYQGIKEKKGLRISNILIAAGLGLGIKIKQTIMINIEPTYATPIWRNNNVPTGFDNRCGLNIGLVYMFKINN